MLADPCLLSPSTSETPESDEPVFAPAALTRAAVPTRFAASSEGNRLSPSVTVAPSREAAARLVLADYAAFVLDQEARYCQQ